MLNASGRTIRLSPIRLAFGLYQTGLQLFNGSIVFRAEVEEAQVVELL
jgi:hypothetical protein